MRIAVVSEGWFPEISGVTIAVVQHLRFLAARGHELLFLHPRYPTSVLPQNVARAVPEPPAERVAFESEPIAPHRPESRIPTLRGEVEIEEALVRFRPDVVIYKNPDRLVPDLPRVWKPRRVAGLRTALAVGAKVIPIIHTLMPLLVERSGTWLWRTLPMAALTRHIWSGIYNDNFAFAVTVDTAARQYLRSIGIRIPILAGPWNGVDTTLFRPGAERTRDGKALRICWIGRIVPEKNAPLLLHLARALRTRGLDFQLVVVGDGPLAVELGRAVQEIGGVMICGWLEPAAVAATLSGSDVYLSLSDAESYSLTASEALASGIPVIAPDVLGFKRLANMNVGRLFPAEWLKPAGMQKLADAMMESIPQLARWAAAARSAASRLGWDVALDAMYAALGTQTGLAL